MTNPADLPSITADEAFALVSRQLDEQLEAADRAKLQRFEAAYPQEIAQFRARCIAVQNLLQQLPVVNEPRLLFAPDPSVELHSASATIRRSGSYRLILSLVTSMMCAALVLALRQHDDLQHAPTASGMTARDTMLAFQRPEPAAKIAAADVQPDANVTLRTSASPSPESQPESLPAVVFHDSDPEIESLVESDNWRVLVVKVDTDDRDLAMDRIRAITLEHGLRLKLSSGDSTASWLGVVLTSVDTTNELIAALETSSEKIVPDTVTETDTSPAQKILTVVRESLRFPTRSELHHGKVFVALPVQNASAKMASKQDEMHSSSPKADASRTANPQLRQALVNGPTAPARRATAIDPATVDAAALNVAAQAEPSVTLVVFEFPNSSAEKTPPESDAVPN